MYYYFHKYVFEKNVFPSKNIEGVNVVGHPHPAGTTSSVKIH